MRVLFQHIPAPWLTKELKQAMRETDRARRIWRRRRDNVSYQRFKLLGNRVQMQVRTAKRIYYQDIFSRLHNSSSIWFNLRYLGLVRARDSDRCLLCTTEEINLFFTSGHLINENINEPLRQNYLLDASFDDRRFYWN